MPGRRRHQKEKVRPQALVDPKCGKGNPCKAAIIAGGAARARALPHRHGAQRNQKDECMRCKVRQVEQRPAQRLTAGAGNKRASKAPGMPRYQRKSSSAARGRRQAPAQTARTGCTNEAEWPRASGPPGRAGPWSHTAKQGAQAPACGEFFSRTVLPLSRAHACLAGLPAQKPLSLKGRKALPAILPRFLPREAPVPAGRRAAVRPDGSMRMRSGWPCRAFLYLGHIPCALAEQPPPSA